MSDAIQEHLSIQEHVATIKRVISEYYPEWEYLGDGRHGVVFRLPKPDYCIKVFLPDDAYIFHHNGYSNELLGLRHLQEAGTNLAPAVYGCGHIPQGYQVIVREELSDVPLYFLENYFLAPLNHFHELMENHDTEPEELLEALSQASPHLPWKMTDYFRELIDVFAIMRDKGVLILDLGPQNMGVDKQGHIKVRDASSFLIDDMAPHMVLPHEATIDMARILKGKTTK